MLTGIRIIATALVLAEILFGLVLIGFSNKHSNDREIITILVSIFSAIQLLLLVLIWL